MNVLNFERLKWGGVRHGDLVYILFDLIQFQKEQIPEPTKEDLILLKNIFHVIDSCQPADYPSALCDRLKEIPNFKSNKEEQAAIIEILAAIDILVPMSYHRPIRGKNDWVFVEYWRGEDGYQKEMAKKYFGKYLE